MQRFHQNNITLHYYKGLPKINQLIIYNTNIFLTKFFKFFKFFKLSSFIYFILLFYIYQNRFMKQNNFYSQESEPEQADHSITATDINQKVVSSTSVKNQNSNSNNNVNTPINLHNVFKKYEKFDKSSIDSQYQNNKQKIYNNDDSAKANHIQLRQLLKRRANQLVTRIVFNHQEQYVQKLFKNTLHQIQKQGKSLLLLNQQKNNHNQKQKQASHLSPADYQNQRQKQKQKQKLRKNVKKTVQNFKSYFDLLNHKSEQKASHSNSKKQRFDDIFQQIKKKIKQQKKVRNLKLVQKMSQMQNSHQSLRLSFQKEREKSSRTIVQKVKPKTKNHLNININVNSQNSQSFRQLNNSQQKDKKSAAIKLGDVQTSIQFPLHAINRTQTILKSLQVPVVSITDRKSLRKKDKRNLQNSIENNVNQDKKRIKHSPKFQLKKNKLILLEESFISASRQFKTKYYKNQNRNQENSSKSVKPTKINPFNNNFNSNEQNQNFSSIQQSQNTKRSQTQPKQKQKHQQKQLIIQKHGLSYNLINKNNKTEPNLQLIKYSNKQQESLPLLVNKELQQVEIEEQFTFRGPKQKQKNISILQQKDSEIQQEKPQQFQTIFQDHMMTTLQMNQLMQRNKNSVKFQNIDGLNIRINTDSQMDQLQTNQFILKYRERFQQVRRNAINRKLMMNQSKYVYRNNNSSRVSSLHRDFQRNILNNMSKKISNNVNVQNVHTNSLIDHNMLQTPQKEKEKFNKTIQKKQLSQKHNISSLQKVQKITATMLQVKGKNQFAVHL